MTSLDQEIAKHRAEIRADGYPMSIGEIASLYQQKELDLHPEFQRFYRWMPYQKSRLIESLLLGLPIPSIFVSQRDNGVWDVVDGLQRLSTIFEFLGILRNEADELIPPLVLEGTKYLPSLSGRTWEGESSIGPANQLLIKRSKLEVQIILRESTENTKFDLFHRLNSSGSQLQPQEMRNCMLVMTNPASYETLRKLKEDPNFAAVHNLSEKNLIEQYDMELITRFFVLHNADLLKIKKDLKDIGEYLDEGIIEVANDPTSLANTASVFRVSFSVLNTTLGSNAFRRFNPTKGSFEGGTILSLFEFFALGIGFLVANRLTVNHEAIIHWSKNLSNDKQWYDNTGSGVRASSRIPFILEMSRAKLQEL